MIDLPAFDRRGLLGGMAALLGVASLPLDALAKPARRARFLPPARFTLLSRVADTMLPTTDTPGALAAEVPARLDAMLRDWAAPATRNEIAGAMDRIDAAALSARGRGFVQLPAADQAEVLRAHDIAALQPAPRAEGDKPSFFDLSLPTVDPGYKRLKGLVISLYYYSPIASEHELPYEHVPGAFEPSLKLTPESRPYLGLGPI